MADLTSLSNPSTPESGTRSESIFKSSGQTKAVSTRTADRHHKAAAAIYGATQRRIFRVAVVSPTPQLWRPTSNSQKRKPGEIFGFSRERPRTPRLLKAANGEIIAASQGYDTKASAEKGIESVKTNAPARRS